MEWICTSTLVLPNVLYTPTDCFAWHPLLHSSDWCLKSWLSRVTEKLFWFALNESAPVICSVSSLAQSDVSFLFGSLISWSVLLSDQRCCDQMTNLLFYQALIKSVISRTHTGKTTDSHGKCNSLTVKMHVCVGFRHSFAYLTWKTQAKEEEKTQRTRRTQLRN